MNRGVLCLAPLFALTACFEDVDDFEVAEGTETTASSTSSTTTGEATTDALTQGEATGSSVTSGGASTTSSTTTDGTTGETTTGPHGESGDSSESSDDNGGTESGEPPTPADFFDDFERADASFIGNGWREKVGAAYRLRNNRVSAEEVEQRSFVDNIVTRGPVVRDVTVEIEFTVGTFSEFNHPFLLARLLGSFTPNERLTGYAMEPRPERGELCVVRLQQNDTDGFRDLACSAYCDAIQQTCLVENGRYRNRLTVRGVDPVELIASIEEFDNGEWVELHTVVATDTDIDDAIVDPGEFGFGGGQTGLQLGNYDFDNFRAVFPD